MVVILNDDEPEIAETFEVQLVSVAESGQRIDTEHVSIAICVSFKLVSGPQIAFRLARVCGVNFCGLITIASLHTHDQESGLWTYLQAYLDLHKHTIT